MACCLPCGVPCPYTAEGIPMSCKCCPYSNGEEDE